MKTLTANFFPPRVKGLGMTWRNTQESSKYIFLSQALKLKLPTWQPVHAVMLKESNYFDSFYYVNSMCPVRWPMYEACMRLNSCLMRRINCFPFVLRGMETHRKQDRRCQECMREGLKGTAWLSLVVLLLIFNAYLRGFCRNHRELNPLLSEYVRTGSMLSMP